MSQTNEPVQEANLPLTPVARARPRLLRGLAWVALLAVLAVLAVMFLVYRTRKQDCRTAARTQPDAMIVLVCEREYLRTGDPEAGAQLADAYRRSKDLTKASAIANSLLVTSARGE